MRYTLFVRAALEALLTNGMRSFLTMLGVIIGVAAIVIIIAVGDGAQSLILNQISSFGSDLIGVLPGSSDEKGPPASAMGVTITSLTNDDLTAIRKQIRGITAMTGYVNGAGSVSWESQSVDAQFSGVSAEYPVVENAELALGNFFTSDDDETVSSVAVLGWQVYQDLFNGTNPLGQYIKIKRRTFRVIGVVAERGTVAFQNQDDKVLIPLRTAQKSLLGIDHVSLARMK
ncbi:MAG: ABC transporter permease, partial [Patescibacteria group bacterium]